MKHFKTISEFHEFVGLPKPQHPLISIVDVSTVPRANRAQTVTMLMDFYSISVKRMENVKITYGQQPFDFNEGIMSFMAPKQVFSIGVDDKAHGIATSGWVIYLHPDFLWNTALAKAIRRYDFWSYSLHEALFLSEREEGLINAIIQAIRQEYETNIDQYSKQIILSQIETLLSYSERFYNRQFITREQANHEVLERFETVMDEFFNDSAKGNDGLPTVQYIAERLHVSPKYLGNLLRTLTGQNTQQHIHERLISKAKELLSTTTLSVSEIAYELGFEHLQSFSKLFKAKTSYSPLRFRQSFNRT